jgi:response regulator of citrate/malate metabolism
MAEKPSLLVIEDEVLLALDVEIMAEAEGFCIAGHAMRGSDAIRLADQVHPDIALVDVQLLDGPTGVDVARELVSRLGVLVVFMTANRQSLPDDLAGACGVILKPYSESGFTQALSFLRAYVFGEILTGEVPAGLELGLHCLDHHMQREDRPPVGSGRVKEVSAERRF